MQRCAWRCNHGCVRAAMLMLVHGFLFAVALRTWLRALCTSLQMHREPVVHPMGRTKTQKVHRLFLGKETLNDG